MAQTSDRFGAQSAIQALGTMGDPSVVALLQTISVDDTRPMIREAALNAIQEISLDS